MSYSSSHAAQAQSQAGTVRSDQDRRDPRLGRSEAEMDPRFVELGRCLCEVRAGQRVSNGGWRN
jgi:hypothetical protein